MNEWIKRGENGSHTLRRLKDAEKILTTDALAKLKAECDKFLGKDYDLVFEWSDDKIYCSELIWKAFDRALGIQIGELQNLKEFNLSASSLQALLEARYGADNISLDNFVISTPATFHSELLETVKDTYTEQQ